VIDQRYRGLSFAIGTLIGQGSTVSISTSKLPIGRYASRSAIL